MALGNDYILSLLENFIRGRRDINRALLTYDEVIIMAYLTIKDIVSCGEILSETLADTDLRYHYPFKVGEIERTQWSKQWSIKKEEGKFGQVYTGN